MKKPNGLFVTGLAAANFLFSLIWFTHPANAGGSGHGPMSNNFVPQTDADLTVEKIEAQKKGREFSWKLWSNPYPKGNLICRQYQGDVACFSPTISNQLNWKVQSAQPTSIPSGNNHVN
jgi:hypothetical protein